MAEEVIKFIRGKLKDTKFSFVKNHNVKRIREEMDRILRRYSVDFRFKRKENINARKSHAHCKEDLTLTDENGNKPARLSMDTEDPKFDCAKCEAMSGNIGDLHNHYMWWHQCRVECRCKVCSNRLLTY